MNTNQTNRITMFKTVSAVLGDHSAVWNGMAPMQTDVQTLRDNNAAIDSAAQQQEMPSGATESKAAAREDLEDVLFLACEALGSLAHANSDHQLSALVDVTPTALHRMGDEELSNRAASVVAAANTRKTDLVPFQVTQANLDELSQALEDFNAVKDAPRRATTDRVAHTKSLPVLIRENNELLRERIDRTVNLFRRTDPNFVASYRAARVIVDRAATREVKKKPPTT